jgi:rhamnogalacturonan endolyase
MLLRLLTAALLLAASISAVPLQRATGPFLTQVDNTTWIFGNDVWNVTQGQTYADQPWYKDRDCVGEAVGHYVSYST